MRSLLTLMVPAVALSFGAFACSGSDPDSSIDDVETQQNQLVDEGRECSAIKQCKPGLACVARVAGGDVGIKGVPAPCEEGNKDCGWSSSSSSTSGASGSSGWSSSGSTGSSGWSSTSSGWTGSSSGWTGSSSGWSSSGGASGWSSSGSTGSSGWSSSGWSSSGGSSGWSSSSSSGSAPQVGVCITVR